MNTHDELDELITQRLRAVAPNDAPDRLLDGAMSRISETPQRGRGWFGAPAGRLLAAAAVLVLAVVVGAQVSGLIGRPVGNEPSPSPSVAPTNGPSATVAPSATAEPEPSQSPVSADDELLLRVQYGGGGPTYPTDLLPWVTLMVDGTLIWQPVVAATEYPSLVSRQLSPEGLDELRERIFGTGLLDESADHELEQRPDAPEPPGRGIGVFTFTAGSGDDEVVVQSVEWLGDEEEATYFEPSPEREALDALARALRDPESMLGGDAWAGPAEPFEGADYQLVLIPYRDVPPYGNPDIADMGLAYDGPIDEFGEAAGHPGEIESRCGVITRAEAASIVQVLADADFGAVGLSMQTSGGIDWAEGNGTVDLFMLPRMPDGFPECEDQR
jgi:hypothetical protein